MIPPFDDRGNLSPGIHDATMDEIAARFGCANETRTSQMESLVWLYELARRAGIANLIINGSFVTSREEPNDIDCALLMGPHFPTDERAAKEIIAGLPFLDIHLMIQEDFDFLVNTIYATDRRMVPKGVIKVQL